MPFALQADRHRSQRQRGRPRDEPEGGNVPQVRIVTGFTAEDGREEILAEYQCDVSGCPNPAEHVMGFARELGGGFAVCAEHAAERPRDEESRRG